MALKKLGSKGWAEAIDSIKQMDSSDRAYLLIEKKLWPKVGNLDNVENNWHTMA
jgi:hypothetical protein